MADDKQPQIFLSYSWANGDIANTIDNDFKSYGISFQRDIRGVKYTKSIKDFMNKITKSDFVIMLISDEYIKSENCMYEVVELLGAHNFEDRILPVVLPNTKIFKPEQRKDYYDFWKCELHRATDILKEHPNEKTIEDKVKFQRVYDSLGVFFQRINDLKFERFEELKQKNYLPILDKIGFEDEATIEKIVQISKLIDIEEQELAIEELFKGREENKYSLSLKSYIAASNNKNKLAKKYFEKLIEIDPDNSDAHTNYAKLLKSAFEDLINSKKHYEIALGHDSCNVDAHYCLGNLLKEDYFKDYIGALRHYEIVIILDPKHEFVYNNLGLLWAEKLSNRDLAKIVYEHGIKIKPLSSFLHFNMAALMINHFTDYINAKKHFEIAIEIDPKSKEAHYNLAIVLQKHFLDYNNARKHFETAISIDPSFTIAYLSLGLLLEGQFSNHEQAKAYYELVIAIDPSNETAKTLLNNVVLMIHVKAHTVQK